MANEQNLKPIQKGEIRNPHPTGRPKKLKNAIKSLPPDMQEKVFGALAFALTLKDEEEAKQYLEKKQGELGEYGIVLQITLKQLIKDGWGFGAMMDVMDRLYGKPRQSAEITHSGGISLHISTDSETKDIIEGGLG